MPPTARKILTWALAIVGSLGLSATLLEWMQLEPFEFQSTRSVPDVSLNQTSLVQYDGAGNRIWSVQAQTLTFDEVRQQTLAEAVEVFFWTVGGEGEAEGPQLTVHAKQLRYDHLSGDLEFANGLEASTPHGLTFRTDVATWSDRAQSLEGAGPVFVEHADALGGTATLQGQGFRYDAATGAVVIHGDPEGGANAQLRIVPQENAPEDAP